MRAKLNRAELLMNIPPEQTLLNDSPMESAYVIRKLKAFLWNDELDLESGAHGQAYSKQFDIWFQPNEFDWL